MKAAIGSPPETNVANLSTNPMRPVRETPSQDAMVAAERQARSQTDEIYGAIIVILRNRAGGPDFWEQSGLA